MAKKKTAKKELPVTADIELVEEYDATRYTPWIPDNMPVGGKSNSTEQLNDHPTEHNHSAEAISDIVDRFADLRLYVPAANSCGVDGDLTVNNDLRAIGKIKGQNGKRSAPSYTFDGAEGSGMYGSDTFVAFSAEADARMVIYKDAIQIFTDTHIFSDLQVDGALNLSGNWSGGTLYNTPTSNREFMIIGDASRGGQIQIYGNNDNGVPTPAKVSITGDLLVNGIPVFRFGIANGIDTQDVLDRAETATMPVLNDEGVPTTDADVGSLSVNEVMTAMLAKIKELSARIEALEATV